MALIATDARRRLLAGGQRTLTCWSRLQKGTSFVFGHALLRPVFLTRSIFNVAFFILNSATGKDVRDGAEFAVAAG